MVSTSHKPKFGEIYKNDHGFYKRSGSSVVNAEFDVTIQWRINKIGIDDISK